MGWLFVIIIVYLIIVAVIYNNLMRLKKNVVNSKSGIDVYLQQRFDLIPNLIEVTKEYMNYEKDLIERITELRTAYKRNKDIQIVNELNHEYNNIMVALENYPELKASEQFLKLQKALIKIESQLQAARRIYNNDVTKYNTRISTFPSNFIASAFKFREEKLFVLDGEDKVKVEFWI